MEKEFKALDFLKQQAIAFEHSELAIKVANENHTIVKQALTELKTIKEVNPSKALELFNFMGGFMMPTADGNKFLKDFCDKEFTIIRQALLKAQEQEGELVKYMRGRTFGKELTYLKHSIEQCNDKPIYYASRSFGNKYIVPEVEYKKLNQEVECLKTENDILKEIIRSFFHKGSPLHQYIDKEFGLTIEVDDDCSIMHLGEYKGVDLDQKLKEVLE